MLYTVFFTGRVRCLSTCTQRTEQLLVPPLHLTLKAPDGTCQSSTPSESQSIQQTSTDFSLFEGSADVTTDN